MSKTRTAIVFGSSKTKQNSAEWEQARLVGKICADANYNVRTGKQQLFIYIY
mgnify:CR=1 FL=1